MPAYVPITDITPLASMVTNTAVSAALCDQIRDDLVALWEGWWFRATRTTTMVSSAGVDTSITFDTLAQSATAEADGVIDISTGSVRTYKPGLWLVGGQFTISSATTDVSLLLQSTDSPGAYLCEDRNDDSSTIIGLSASAVTEVTTTPNIFSVWVNSVSSVTVQTSMTALWGVYLGGNP